MITRARAWALVQRLLRRSTSLRALHELHVYWQQHTPQRQCLFLYRLWTLFECHAKLSGLGLWRYLHLHPPLRIDIYSLWFNTCGRDYHYTTHTDYGLVCLYYPQSSHDHGL